MSVPISNAQPFAGTKSFSVALSGPSGGATLSTPSTATVGITGDAPAPVGTLQLSASSYAVDQNSGAVTVTLDRAGGSSGAVSVAYATVNGTAIAGTDFTTTDGSLSWADGDTSSKTVSIPISNATPFSASKSFSVALSAPTGGATLGSPNSASVNIAGDAAPAVGSVALGAVRREYGLAAFDGRLLACRHVAMTVRLKVINRKWAMMMHMRIKRQHQRWTLLHQPNARMATTMNPTLMAFGTFEPTLQIQIVC